MHDVADCVLESLSPVVFDSVQQIAQTGRFVIVDEYDIVGGGIVFSSEEEGESLLQRHIREREVFWQRSNLGTATRSVRYNQQAILVIVSCENNLLGNQYARVLEEELFHQGRYVYYLAPRNIDVSEQDGGAVDEGTVKVAQHQQQILQHSLQSNQAERSESLQRLGEMVHMFCDSGAILITALGNLDRDELELLSTLHSPYKQIVVQIGQGYLPAEAVHLQLDKELALTGGIAALTRLLTAEDIFSKGKHPIL